jgi:hypothetical protein
MMVAEVRKLETSREVHRKSTIETIEEALRQAKAGEVIAVGIAVVRPLGSINTAFSDTDNCAALIGAAALLQHRIVVATEKV